MHSVFLSPHSAISTEELMAIEDKLPTTLKVDMDNTFRKRLEYEFHTAGYHVMLETTTGLRNATGHLVKVKKTFFVTKHKCV